MKLSDHRLLNVGFRNQYDAALQARSVTFGGALDVHLDAVAVQGG